MRFPPSLKKEMRRVENASSFGIFQEKLGMTEPISGKINSYYRCDYSGRQGAQYCSAGLDYYWTITIDYY